MPQDFFRIAPLTIRMDAPLHIGTGYRRGLIHRTVVRDRKGCIYLPASSLKGKVRSTCEGLTILHNLEPCRAPYPQALYDCRVSGCLVCRVFGAPGLGAEIFWHNAHLVDWPQEQHTLAQTSIRTQIQLSRERGVSSEDHLFAGEASTAGLVFRSDDGISGRISLTRVEGDPDLHYELLLLLAGLKLVHSLGGNTSRGMGACAIELPSIVQVNDRSLLIVDLLEQLEFLALWPQPRRSSHG